jgi:L-seryl-tRNA(Ser) seleniumtransferase
MADPHKQIARLPSVDRVASHDSLSKQIERHGRAMVINAIRDVIAAMRMEGRTASEAEIAAQAAVQVAQKAAPQLRPVFNLTGVVLHTNLGRAILSEAAIEQAAMAIRGATNLEFDLDSGARGERDSLVEALLIELTGAEAAVVVNNNAAAVLLTLAALAEGREVVISRGELVEIGGSFRIPDVMTSAQAKLIEVGTTNRTHATDYERAIGPHTAALMKVHASNYVVTGFVAAVADADVATIAHSHDLPLIVDLGSGSLIDLSEFGLPKEPVVRDVVAAGCDIVTFSGDKLLGGPQAGLIVGRKALIDRIARHPLKRALRAPKQTYAALEATLLAYRAPDRVMQTLPTLRHLTRPLGDIEATVARLQPQLSAVLGGEWLVTAAPVKSQIGSGSLPVETIPSMALSIRRRIGRGGKALKALSARFRALPVPMIGRISGDALLLDLRCLDDEAGLVVQFGMLGRG